MSQAAYGPNPILALKMLLQLFSAGAGKTFFISWELSNEKLS